MLGGGRSRWEHALFDGAYDDVEPADRPRYGGLDLLPYPDGACPRFGSTHLRLRRETPSRCTLAWGDSVTDPSVLRTWDQVVDVLAAAAADAAPEMRGEARTGADRLDPYVEAHVHGGLRMSDVEAVVTDPSYRDTPVWEDLSRACSRSGSTLRTHAGYALAADAVDPPSARRGRPISPARSGILRATRSPRQRSARPAAPSCGARPAGRGSATGSPRCRSSSTCGTTWPPSATAADASVRRAPALAMTLRHRALTGERRPLRRCAGAPAHRWSGPSGRRRPRGDGPGARAGGTRRRRSPPQRA